MDVEAMSYEEDRNPLLQRTRAAQVAEALRKARHGLEADVLALLRRHATLTYTSDLAMEYHGLRGTMDLLEDMLRGYTIAPSR